MIIMKPSLLLLLMLTLQVDQGGSASVSRCQDDGDCELGHFCLTKLSRSICELCVDCRGRFFRAEKSRNKCARTPDECGDCIGNYVEEAISNHRRSHRCVPDKGSNHDNEDNLDDNEKFVDKEMRVDEEGRVWYSQEAVNLVLLVIIITITIILSISALGYVVLRVVQKGQRSNERAQPRPRVERELELGRVEHEDVRQMLRPPPYEIAVRTSICSHCNDNNIAVEESINNGLSNGAVAASTLVSNQVSGVVSHSSEVSEPKQSVSAATPFDLHAYRDHLPQDDLDQVFDQIRQQQQGQQGQEAEQGQVERGLEVEASLEFDLALVNDAWDAHPVGSPAAASDVTEPSDWQPNFNLPESNLAAIDEEDSDSDCDSGLQNRLLSTSSLSEPEPPSPFTATEINVDSALSLVAVDLTVRSLSDTITESNNVPRRPSLNNLRLLNRSISLRENTNEENQTRMRARKRSRAPTQSLSEDDASSDDDTQGNRRFKVERVDLNTNL